MIGDFGLVKGNDSVGVGIRLAETLNGDGPSLYSHAFIVITDEADPQIVEAEPGGARIGRLSEYNEDGYTLSHWPLTYAQRTNVVVWAKRSVGIPYSFLDYLSLAALRLHVRPKWMLKYVANTDHMICSQLVDYIYNRADLHMFSDNRFPGDVTPQDLQAVLAGPS